jgi:hypothetical protein
MQAKEWTRAWAVQPRGPRGLMRLSPDLHDI